MEREERCHHPLEDRRRERSVRYRKVGHHRVKNVRYRKEDHHREVSVL